VGVTVKVLRAEGTVLVIVDEGDTDEVWLAVTVGDCVGVAVLQVEIVEDTVPHADKELLRVMVLDTENE
jgi:hypothetical protein